MIADFEQRTWYQLRAVARAVRIPFDTRWSRAQAYERVRHRMIEQQEMQRCYKQLSAVEKRALQTLQAANGVMPRSRFTRHFGKIRICRQRHHESESARWRYPASAAEKLWLYGFIESVRSQHEQIVLTEEAARLLPPLPHPVQQMSLPEGLRAFTKSDLTRDVAVWLGTLPALKVRLLHGRWLPPSALRKVNERLPCSEKMDGIRSELACGRLRFLHYLAEASGLVGTQGGSLQPTAAAWQWLDQPDDERWNRLWLALEADRQAGGVLWQCYRLPELPEAAWNALTRSLRQLPAGAYDLSSLVDAIRPYCLPDPNVLGSGEGLLWRGILALLDSVFPWLGYTYRVGNTFIVCADDTAVPSALATLTTTDDSLQIDLPNYPRLRPLAEIMTYTQIENWTLRINREAIRRASANGIHAIAVAETLAALCGRLPIALLDRLKQWEREAASLRLHPMMVLTADDPAVLDALCADRGLRALVDTPLSAHHLAIRADQADKLIKRLERRKQPVTHYPTYSAQLDSRPLDPAAAAYAYLAICVFQGLADFAPLPATIPAAAREAVAASLSAEDRSTLDQMASQTLNTLSTTIEGFAAASPVERSAPDEIGKALRHAYETRGAVTVDYFSPARGAITTRQIKPVRWYDQNGATYIEAWCALNGETRTFRLDRVMHVHTNGGEVTAPV